MNVLTVARIAAFLFAASVSQGHAATYYFNATTDGTPGTSAGIAVAVNNVIGFIGEPGVGGPGYQTPLFVFPSGEFRAGDTIDFGSVALYPSSIYCDQYEICAFGYNYIDLNWVPGVSEEGGGVIEPNGFQNCFAGAPNSTCLSTLQSELSAMEASPIIVPLIFTLGTGTTDIQMAWAFADYTPPAQLTASPVPSALPLFASALGALGLFGWNRKRTAPGIGNRASIV